MANGERENTNQKNLKRRMNTDCNYSVLSTLLMRFLKEKNIYWASRDLAKKMGVKEEKNYSIIVLRLAFFLSEKTLGTYPRHMATAEIFDWLENEVDKCIVEKYGENTQEFRRLAKKRNLQLIKIFRRVFEASNLRDEEAIKDIIIDVYMKKRVHTKTHEKNAEELARIIVEVVGAGEEVGNSQCYSKRSRDEDTLKSSECESESLCEEVKAADEQLFNLCDEDEMQIFTLSLKDDSKSSLIDLTFCQDLPQIGDCWETITKEKQLSIQYLLL